MSASRVSHYDEQMDAAYDGTESHRHASQSGPVAIIDPNPRRNALKRARLHRAGELTPVWVPSPEQEAMRDLTRAREDMKALQTKARQRLSAFLLRHNRIYPGKSRWTRGVHEWAGGAVLCNTGAASGVSGIC